MLKSIANLTISKEKINVCLIGRSSAEWRITSPYLHVGTSQKATAPQQCHLVALTENKGKQFSSNSFHSNDKNYIFTRPIATFVLP